MLTVAVRGNADVVCADATRVTVAAPTPLAGRALTHEALGVTSQAPSAGVTVTPTTCVPPLTGGDHVAGLTVTAGGAPPCETASGCPPTVTNAVLGAADEVCGSAVRVTTVLPVPESGLTVSQACELEAVHAASGNELVSIDVRVSPPWASAGAGDAHENCAVAPPWVTVMVRPPMLAVAERASADVVCGAAIIVTVADPVPPVGVTVSQAWFVEAVQVALAAELLRATDVVSPAAAAAQLVGVTANDARASAAAAMRMRGNVRPLRASVTVAPVVFNAERTASTDAVGRRSRSNAHAPVT